MINSDNLCMSCMQDIGDEKQCPYCGFHSDTPQIAPYLPIRTVLGNRYLVGKLLSYNGDGATYMGLDLTTREPVNIREFYPANIAERDSSSFLVSPTEGKEAVFNDCRQSFADMWQKLRKLSGLSALIKVQDVLEGNGSVYAVTENIEGVTLRDYLLRNNSGCLPWESARALLMPVLSTLGTLHSSGIIHGAVSPTALIVAADGKIRITEFSINSVRTAHGDLTTRIFPGYAAYEQYSNNERLGTWTDIYGFGAVLYRTLIGTDPIDVAERVANDRLMIPGRFAEQLPAYVINGLVNALQIKPEDRTKTVEELRAELSASPVATVSGYETKPVQSASSYKNTAQHLEPEPDTESRTEPGNNAEKGKRSKVVIIVSAVIILLAVLFIGLWKGGVIDLEPKTTAAYTGEMVDVPNFIGKNYDDIMDDQYYTKNFRFEKTEIFSATVNEGEIISQDAEVGTKIPKDSAIKLTVSKGRELIEFPSTGVIGAKYDEASSYLSKMGFKVLKVDKLNTNGQTAGIVSDVSLSSGEKYEKGTTVYLFVWSKQEVTTTSEPETTTEGSDDSGNFWSRFRNGDDSSESDDTVISSDD